MDPRFKGLTKEQIVKGIMDMNAFNEDPLGVYEEEEEDDWSFTNRTMEEDYD